MRIKFVILALLSTVLLTGAFAFAADDSNKAGQQKDVNNIVSPRPFELSDEMIDRIMARLAEDEPEKAKQLQQLRKEDPAKFREEINKIIREHMGERMRDFWGQFGEEGPPGRMGRPGVPGGFGIPGRPGEGEMDQQRTMEDMMQRRFGWMGERVEEFNKWLKENYPNEANKLEELQKKDPELYQRQWRLIAGKYWRIFEVSKENPELARILKEQIELNDTQERLVRQLRRADNEQEKEKLIGQLKDVLNKKYDLIVAQKKIAYEMLRKRLENLQKHVEESQTNVEKWQKPEFKKQQVEERLKDLVGTSDKFEWD